MRVWKNAVVETSFLLCSFIDILEKRGFHTIVTPCKYQFHRVKKTDLPKMHFHKAQNKTTLRCFKKSCNFSIKKKTPIRLSQKFTDANKISSLLIQSFGDTWISQDSGKHFVNPSVSDERPRLCNSPFAGFTHSLIGVYIIPVQSALSGTLAAVCVSRWD